MSARGPERGSLGGARVADAVAPIEPVATAELPALGSDERSDPDAVADAYGGAYEALIE